VTYCDIWNPIGVDFFNVTPGAGVISEDPLFADRNGLDNVAGTEDDNFRILFPSPCIDAGSDVSGSVGYDEASIPNTGKGGSSNDIGREEYIPELRILRVEISTNDVRVHFLAFTNKTYQLESATNLSSHPVDWSPVGSVMAGNGLVVEQTDPGAAQLPQRFYRLREF
jgi:hypothetical protein